VEVAVACPKGETKSTLWTKSHILYR
jgi:hypothetical protein